MLSTVIVFLLLFYFSLLFTNIHLIPDFSFQLSNFVTLVKKKLTMMKKPNGTSIFPARTCKDLYMSYPDLPSGMIS